MKLKLLALIQCILYFNCECQSITLLKNVKIDYANDGNQTKFLITSPLDASIDPTNAWLGVGLNSIQKMV